MPEYLRISLTALSLTACVLLVALWVRSYYWTERVNWGTRTSHGFRLSSQYGVAYFRYRGFYDGRHTRFVFHFTGWGEPFVVGIPYWFLVPFTMAVAALPWIGKLHWRFSLRTLLIATTLVAVALGIVILSS
jgi:hypothetical protein